MIYYKKNLGDFARDTAHLTMLEIGAYNLLLDRIYATGRGIHEEDAYRVARARCKLERAAVDRVLHEFFINVDGIWRNLRAEKVIEDAKIKNISSVANGKKGGRPKQKQDSECVNNQEHDEPNGFYLAKKTETQKKDILLTINNIKKTTTNVVVKESETETRKNKPSEVQCPQDVSKQVFTDWVEQRRLKRAAVTQTAIDGLRRKGAKADMTLEQVMRECCENGWQGFRPSWVQDKKQDKTVDAKNFMEALTGRSRKDERFIETEFSDITYDTGE